MPFKLRLRKREGYGSSVTDGGNSTIDVSACTCVAIHIHTMQCINILSVTPV